MRAHELELVPLWPAWSLRQLETLRAMGYGNSDSVRPQKSLRIDGHVIPTPAVGLGGGVQFLDERSPGSAFVAEVVLHLARHHDVGTQQTQRRHRPLDVLSPLGRTISASTVVGGERRITRPGVSSVFEQVVEVHAHDAHPCCRSRRRSRVFLAGD